MGLRLLSIDTVLNKHGALHVCHSFFREENAPAMGVACFICSRILNRFRGLVCCTILHHDVLGLADLAVRL